MVEALMYKIGKFGVNLEGPEKVYCDKKLVVTKSSIPVSVLNKRHNTICYHRVRESQADGMLRVGCILIEYNLADLSKKTTIAGNMRHGMV